MSEVGRTPREVEDDLLLDFVNGLLPPGEQRRVLARAARDATYEDRLRAVSASFERARADAPEASIAPGSPRPRRPLATVGIAAVAAALLLLLQPTRPTSHDDLPSYWIPLESEFLRSRSDATDSMALEEGLAAYRRHEPARAVERLEALRLPEGLDDLRRVVLAGAQLQADDAAAADRTIEGLDVPTLPQPWRDRTSWIRYLAWRRLGRDADADRLLETLASSSGDIGRRARREQDRLRP